MSEIIVCPNCYFTKIKPCKGKKYLDKWALRDLSSSFSFGYLTPAERKNIWYEGPSRERKRKLMCIVRIRKGVVTGGRIKPQK